MYTIAMAYCGTGNNKAIRQLLHVAVSDVNDDVRRAAVTGLGFLLFKQPDHCPGIHDHCPGIHDHCPGILYI